MEKYEDFLNVFFVLLDGKNKQTKKQQHPMHSETTLQGLLFKMFVNLEA